VVEDSLTQGLAAPVAAVAGGERDKQYENSGNTHNSIIQAALRAETKWVLRYK